MNARSMRKRKENVCNSIISNFCGDFFFLQERKTQIQRSDLFFYCASLWILYVVGFFFVRSGVACLHPYIIHSSIHLMSFVKQDVFDWNFFFHEALACINALLRLFQHNKCISCLGCVCNAEKKPM